MTRKFVSREDGRKRYVFMIVTHDDGAQAVLVRRGDLRSSKWSAGNVTPADLAWIAAQS